MATTQQQPKTVTSPASDNGQLNISPEEAQAALAQEADRLMKQYNEGMVRLSEETGYGIAPAVIFPGNEEVLLVNFLKALRIEAQPAFKIVRNA